MEVYSHDQDFCSCASDGVYFTSDDVNGFLDNVIETYKERILARREGDQRVCESGGCHHGGHNSPTQQTNLESGGSDPGRVGGSNPGRVGPETGGGSRNPGRVGPGTGGGSNPGRVGPETGGGSRNPGRVGPGTGGGFRNPGRFVGSNPRRVGNFNPGRVGGSNPGTGRESNPGVRGFNPGRVGGSDPSRVGGYSREGFWSTRQRLDQGSNGGQNNKGCGRGWSQ